MADFIKKVLKYTWKYGVKKIAQVVNWIRKNWSQVKNWIEGGLSVPQIIVLILRILGL